MMSPISPRFTYKLVSANDLAKFSELVVDHHVREFLMEGEELSIEECQEFISTSQALHAQHGLGLYLIHSENDVVGYCGFMNTHPPSADLDVVYAFPKKQSGKGYATEVCKALVEFAKTAKFTGGITAVVNPENTASIKVLEKSGFKNEGYCTGDLDHLLKYRCEFPA
ncbi:GNAT family N-acetyltransferase [Bdellovibrio sp. HCB290]|uniref:GNAT family N-acetyltransferase n=1 Tax=Bdellovibrio sp. HCB290 TaxID=3394356 RepID=UPI0039B561DF